MFFRSLALTLFLAATSTVTSAQRLPQWMTKQHFWVNVGAGGGGGMGQFMLQGSYQTQYHLVSLHYLTGSDFAGLDGDSISWTAAQVAASYGVIYGGKDAHVSLSAGLGMLFGHHPHLLGLEFNPDTQTNEPVIVSKNYSVLAVPVSVQAYVHINDFSGLGISYIQTFSSKKTYGAFNVALSFGALK